MMQRSLFDSPCSVAPVPPPRPAVPFARKSETSRAAAQAITPGVRAMAAQVLEHITRCGTAGATDQEIAAAIDMLSDTARARRVGLRDAGLVIDSGQRRASPNGRPSTVWIVPHFLRNIGARTEAGPA